MDPDNMFPIAAVAACIQLCIGAAIATWSDAQSTGIQLQTDTLSWDQVVLVMLSWGALILVWVTGGLPLHFNAPLDIFYDSLNEED